MATEATDAEEGVEDGGARPRRPRMDAEEEGARRRETHGDGDQGAEEGGARRRRRRATEATEEDDHLWLEGGAA